MKPEFWAWATEEGDESDATLILDCVRPEDAAECYIEAEHGRLDYPTEIEVSVKDEKGNITQWVVTAEETVVFHVLKK